MLRVAQMIRVLQIGFFIFEVQMVDPTVQNNFHTKNIVADQIIYIFLKIYLLFL
jgi:hypothetical protein